MPTILIYWSPGRTHEQKAAVIREITEVMVTQGGARREDVLVIFQDIQPGDFGHGGIIPALPVTKTTDGGSSD
jgi:4-oxalocrotonate tautomerase family enzyme